MEKGSHHAAGQLLTTSQSQQQEVEQLIAQQEVEKLIASKTRETPDNLSALRAGLTTTAARLDAAAKFKAEANDHFGMGDTAMALRMYLTAETSTGRCLVHM